MNYVVLRHKGSFVKVARLITRKDIPRLIRLNITPKYFKYDGSPKGQINPFN